MDKDPAIFFEAVAALQTIVFGNGGLPLNEFKGAQKKASDCDEEANKELALH
jgi:hypothetical protein